MIDTTEKQGGKMAKSPRVRLVFFLVSTPFSVDASRAFSTLASEGAEIRTRMKAGHPPVVKIVSILRKILKYSRYLHVSCLLYPLLFAHRGRVSCFLLGLFQSLGALHTPLPPG